MAGILVIGFVFVDIKGFAAGDYIPQGRNLGNVKFLHGGVSRNVAENIANTGTAVTFASLCERTDTGHAVLQRLQRAGVDTANMQMVAQNGIGKWLVILDAQGDAVGQISCPPDQAALEAWVLSQGERLVKDADSVILELDTSEIIDEAVLTWAKMYRKPVYTVVGNMHVILQRRDFLSALDCFVCNEIEAGRLFDQDLTQAEPADVLAVLRKKIDAVGCPSMVVTLGARGAVYLDTRTDEMGMEPACPTHLVDSTGAGDAFLSGVVMGLRRGMRLSDAVRAGTRLASAAIQTEESCAPKQPDFWGMACVSKK